jgi:pyruvate dehydrogenase E1 component alpha subunit
MPTMTATPMVSSLAPTALRDLYEQMVLIRAFETEAERQYKAAKIGGYCHVASGQEAVIVGALHALRERDLLITGYRCHGFALARGTAAKVVMAELFGRRDGCSGGRGGSMHMINLDRGYYGGWGIVGGQLPIATGLALALVRQGQEQAVLCELGDGAVNIGAWHEALNLAALWSLPVVFLIVNNGYGMGTSVERAAAEPKLYRRATAFRMHGERVDGADLAAVVEASERLLDRARQHREPAVLEAMTYRYRGHSVADAGLVYRTRDEIADHKADDPILRVRLQLRQAGVTEDELDLIGTRADGQVRDAVAFADASPEPDLADLAAGTYAPGSAGQFARMRPGAAFGEDALVFDAGLGR